MRRTASKLGTAVFRPVNPAGTIIIAAVSLVWGFWIANPWWAIFGRSQTYAFIRNLLPFGDDRYGIHFDEVIVGGGAMLMGAIILYGLLKYDFVKIIWACRIGTLFWMLISLSYLLGDWHSPAFISIGGIALYCAYMALNINYNRDYYKNYWNKRATIRSIGR